MGTYKRLPREKDKKLPGSELATTLDHAYHWIEHNWKHFLSGVGVLALVVVAVLSIISYSNSGSEKANNLLFQATKLAPDSDAIIGAYQKVMDTYPNSSAAQMARLKLSDIYYSKSDYQKSEEFASSLEKSSYPEIRILGLNNIAAAQLGKGDAKAAAATYLKAFNDNKNMVKGLSYFNAGLAYLEAGQKDEAKKVFEELAKEETEFSTSELRSKSKDELIWIASKP